MPVMCRISGFENEEKSANSKKGKPNQTSPEKLSSKEKSSTVSSWSLPSNKLSLEASKE
jgi:hypothetical protein